MSQSPEQLRIAVVAPPWFEIPPAAYGGTEWLCYWLIEGLIDRGHEVTLVAAGRNNTRAAFLRTYAEPPSDRLGEALPELVHATAAHRALDTAGFDVLHDHSLAGPLLARGRGAPTVVTVHSSVEGELGSCYSNLDDAVSFVAISDSQRRLRPEINWVGRVHNAVRVRDYPFQEDKEDFVLFLGRINPDKGVHLAIDAARSAGSRIVIAGKCIEPRERRYLEEQIAPRLGPDAEWIGQAKTDEKQDLLKRARCLVFPVQWEEPFGLVMVEAMACGTPVVALRRGAIPEVVDHGITGFVCDEPGELAEAIERADVIEPRACRERALALFDAPIMVDGYEAIYRSISARTRS